MLRATVVIVESAECLAHVVPLRPSLATEGAQLRLMTMTGSYDIIRAYKRTRSNYIKSIHLIQVSHPTTPNAIDQHFGDTQPTYPYINRKSYSQVSEHQCHDSPAIQYPPFQSRPAIPIPIPIPTPLSRNYPKSSSSHNLLWSSLPSP